MIDIRIEASALAAARLNRDIFSQKNRGILS